MSRILHTLAASLLFLLVTTLVAFGAYFLNITSFWIMFGIGCAVLAVGIGFGFARRTSAKVAAFFVNAISMGFFLQSWYINRGFDNPLWLMLCVAALAVAYMVVFALPLFIPIVNRHYGLYLVIFILLSLAGYVALLLFTTTTWVSTLGYYGILQLSFILGSSFNADGFDDEIHALWISSYSIVVCAVIILMVVAGGDGCDCGGDCATGDIASPVKRQKGKDSPSNLLP